MSERRKRAAECDVRGGEYAQAVSVNGRVRPGTEPVHFEPDGVWVRCVGNGPGVELQPQWADLLSIWGYGAASGGLHRVHDGHGSGAGDPSAVCRAAGESTSVSSAADGSGDSERAVRSAGGRLQREREDVRILHDRPFPGRGRERSHGAERAGVERRQRTEPVSPTVRFFEGTSGRQVHKRLAGDCGQRLRTQLAGCEWLRAARVRYWAVPGQQCVSVLLGAGSGGRSLASALLRGPAGGIA